MKGLVLDASVAMAWYLPESFSTEARRWQRLMLEGEIALVVPSLHYWEVANVLRTYVVRGEIDAGLATEIYALHLEAPLALREPDRAEVLPTALRFASTAYDAVYIALALGSDLSLLTAERTTTPWVVKLGRRLESVR
jgi:predicted nucleic acid-binding protein